MREYALPVAGVLLNLALNLSIAKDWTKRLPDSVVVALWVLSLVPLGYWLWTYPRIFTFLRTRYVISMIFIVLLGALCGGGVAGMTYAFWYHSRSQTANATASTAPKPQEQTSDKKKDSGDKSDTPATDAEQKKNDGQTEKKSDTRKVTPKTPEKSSPSVPAQQPTFSVTNPSSSIKNQGTTVKAPQTINNFAPPELTMNDSQRFMVVSYLTPLNADISSFKIHIFVDGPTASTQAFGEQLRRALSEAGAVVDKTEGMLMPPEGSTVYPGISFDCVTDANKDKASAIGLALQNAGVLDKPVHALRGNREDGGIGITIRKP